MTAPGIHPEGASNSGLEEEEEARRHGDWTSPGAVLCSWGEGGTEARRGSPWSPPPPPAHVHSVLHSEMLQLPWQLGTEGWDCKQSLTTNDWGWEEEGALFPPSAPTPLYCMAYFPCVAAQEQMRKGTAGEARPCLVGKHGQKAASKPVGGWRLAPSWGGGGSCSCTRPLTY